MTLAGTRLLWTSLLLVAVAVSAGEAKLKVGDDPPDAFGKSSSGAPVHLGDYRGRIVVISFWASWCPPCQKEIPMLMALQKHATREKVVVLSVNWRQDYDEFRRLKRILEERGSELTLISDAHGHAGQAYGVKAIPHMIIVGRDGKIAAIHVGYNEREIPALIDEINAIWRETSADEETSTDKSREADKNQEAPQ